MTSLNTIKEFMVSNPQFPYHLLMRLYPIEMAAVLEAFMTVGERRFYGYRKDPGVAKSTNYRNITWVAKTVLEKQGGGTHLREYRRVQGKSRPGRHRHASFASFEKIT